MTRIYGIFAVLTTPFFDDGRIDYEGMAGNVDWLIRQGIHGVVPLGSTGEFASLSDQQKETAMQTVIQAADGRIPVMVGTSAETTEKAIEYASVAQKHNADGILLLPPWYYTPSAEEVVFHYKAVSDAVDIPIMIYNNPWSSKVDIQAETVCQLAQLKNVTHIKESTGDIRRITEIRTLTSDQLTIFCGWEDLAYESLVMGAKGWICVAANFAPKICVELFEAIVEKKDLEAGWVLYKRLLPALRYLEKGGKMHQTVKYALDQLGLCGGESSHPRLPLNDTEREAVRALLDDLE